MTSPLNTALSRPASPELAARPVDTSSRDRARATASTDATASRTKTLEAHWLAAIDAATD